MDSLRELVNIISAEHPQSSYSPVFYSGGLLGGSADYLYCGVLTCEFESVALAGPGGAQSDAVSGLPQVFTTASGSPFSFVGYRVYCPSPVLISPDGL